MRIVLAGVISVMALSCSHGGTKAKPANPTDDKSTSMPSPDSDGDEEKPATPTKKKKSSGKVASRGNKTTEAYDQTQFALDAADKEDMEAEDWVPKGHGKSWVLQTRMRSFAKADQLATDGLAEVERERKDGSWEEGMSYEVEGPDHSGIKTLEQDDVLNKLAEMQKHAHDKTAELKTALSKAFRKEFPHASKAQLAKLDGMGLPVEITPGKKKGETCWRYNVDNDDNEDITCWKKTGALASHTKKAGEKTEDHVDSKQEEACKKRCKADYMQCSIKGGAVECGDTRFSCENECRDK